MSTYQVTIAGLNKPGIEIFTSESGLQAFHNGKQVGFWQLPEDAIKDFTVGLDPASSKEETECFVASKWGKLDEVADRDETGTTSKPEYTGGTVYFDNGQEVSPCEKLVLQLIEMAPHAIADRLYLSPNTVNNHIKNLLKKSGLPDAKSLAVFAVRMKLI